MINKPYKLNNSKNDYESNVVREIREDGIVNPKGFANFITGAVSDINVSLGAPYEGGLFTATLELDGGRNAIITCIDGIYIDEGNVFYTKVTLVDKNDKVVMGKDETTSNWKIVGISGNAFIS